MVGQNVMIEADSHKEFVEKVKEDAQKRGMGSLAFLKAVSHTVTFRDMEGNRTYYVWDKKEKENE
jgi:hypothetical protein